MKLWWGVSERGDGLEGGDPHVQHVLKGGEVALTQGLNR